MARNIILIGLMGSGKTTLGKYLAGHTGIKFFDTDELIVQKTGKSIQKIFEDEGQLHFRDLESEVIAEVSRKSGCVISTGGGAVLRDENIDSLKKTGVLFYLETSAETLWNRVKNDSSRPLLQGKNPAETLAKILTARKPLYRQADFTVNTEKSLEEIATQVLQFYSQTSER